MKPAEAENSGASPAHLLRNIFRRRSLFGKYVATFVGLVALVLAVSSAVDVWITYRDTKNMLLHAQGEKADAAAQRVEQFLAELERQIGWAARAASRDQRREDFRRILADTPAIAEIAEVDGAGVEAMTLTRAGGALHTGDSWTLTAAFREARPGGAWFGPVVFASTGPRMQVAMGEPGSAGGFAVAEVELGYLSEILRAARTDPGVFAYITTSEGRLIAHTDPAVVGRNPDMSKLPQVHALKTASAPLDIGADLSGESVLSAAATVPRLNWLVFVEQPVSQSFGPVFALLTRLALTSALGLVLCVVAGTLLARRMIVPIRAVQEGASRVAAGDFSHSIDVRTGDEVEALADEFNRMAGQLREFYARLEQKVDDRTHDLARSVRELISLEEIGRDLAASLELGEVLQTALTRAVELAEADGGAIYTFDHERGAFLLAEAHGLDPSFVAALREVKLTRLDGLLGEVAKNGRTVQAPDIAAESGFPLRAPTLAAGFRSALVVPLIAPEGVLGALVVESRRLGPFPAGKVSLMQAFAHQSVLAMRNARLFRKVEENSRQLAIASEHKSRFFANMSHELRTPLNAILGYAELLRDGLYGELPERAVGVLERVESNGAHLLALINDVLDLSKLEAGELSLVLDEYSLRAIIDQVVGSVYSLAHAKGLRIETDVTEPLPLGRGDERRLLQVLLNILSNAIKFTDVGCVAIRACARDGMFEIAISDTGPGIAPDDQARIFEAFQQGDNTSTRLKGGTGLGLSISRRFIEMHGGAIEVASTPGEGATFTIHIPIRVERQKAAA